MRPLFNKLIAQLILIGDDSIPYIDKLRYIIEWFLHLAPVVFILSIMHLWFEDNKQFSHFVLVAMTLNVIVGIVKHLKFKTFSFPTFLYRNSFMIISLVIIYMSLEMLVLTVGNNIAGEAFEKLVQVMTLQYPISKVVKNVFILSRGKYPPEFIIKKLYNFEKNGDLQDFFSSKKTDGDMKEEYEKYKEEMIKNRDEE